MATTMLVLYMLRFYINYCHEFSCEQLGERKIYKLVPAPDVFQAASGERIVSPVSSLQCIAVSSSVESSVLQVCLV